MTRLPREKKSFSTNQIIRNIHECYVILDSNNHSLTHTQTTQPPPHSSLRVKRHLRKGAGSNIYSLRHLKAIGGSSL